MSYEKGTAGYKNRKRKFFSPAYQHGKLKNAKQQDYKIGDIGLLRREDNTIYVTELTTEEDVVAASALWQQIRKETRADLTAQRFAPKGYTEPTMQEIDKKLSGGGSLARAIAKQTGVRIE